MGGKSLQKKAGCFPRSGEARTRVKNRGFRGMILLAKRVKVERKMEGGETQNGTLVLKITRTGFHFFRNSKKVSLFVPLDVKNGWSLICDSGHRLAGM